MRTLLALAALAATAAGAGQVHLGLGATDDVITVSWATASGDGDSEVIYASTADLSGARVAGGDVRAFTADPGRTWYTRTAKMSGLAVGERYYYKVGDAVNGYSEVFSFVNRKKGAPFRHVLFGDMGAEAAFSLCNACEAKDPVCDAARCSGNTTAGLVAETGGTADMFLHVGDFAYDFDKKNGELGDQFMKNIEQVAARVPYMVSHGNHEDTDVALAHYIERFRAMPVNSEPATFESVNGEAPNTLYFSWDFGLVHYIAFSTELWHGVGSDKVTKDTFLAWFEKDLQKANENRANAPWILIHGHRPLYSSAAYSADPDVRDAIEDLMFKYGVSFSLNGHQHNYERSWPLYKNLTTQSYENPNAPIYVVSGAAGSHELHTPFEKQMPGWVGFRSNSFGYTRMVVHNASHIHFQQVSTDPTTFPLSEYGKVIDDFWVVQHNQGPFDPARAPKDLPTSCDSPLCGDHDHFAPLLLPRLGEPAGSTRPLWRVIQEYRATHGEVAWAQQLNRLLREVSGRGEWEDGLLDEEEQAALQWIGHSSQQ